MAAALGRMLRTGLLAGASIAPSTRPLACRFVPPQLASSRALSSRVAAKAPAVPDLDADDDEFEGYEDGLADASAALQRRVLALKKVQESYDVVNRDYQKELALLQAKYYEKYQPLFDQRKDVVLGVAPVDKFDIEDDGQPDTGIPEFWLTAFINHEKVRIAITERDEEVLKHLVDVRARVLTGEDRGFELAFHFKENEFLENKVLTKTYILHPEEDVVPKEFVGSEIKWKGEDRNPTVQARKQRVKGAGKGKGKPTFTVTYQPCESFFNFFDPPKIPANPTLEDLEDEELDELQQELSADFDIGFSIKDQILPRAVEWFTGELSEPLDLDEDEFEGEEEFDDSFDERSDERLPPLPPPRKGGKATRG